MADLGRAGEQGRILARGAGCTACGGTGYRGRVGLFEVLPMSEQIRMLVAERASTSDIHKAAVAEGMRTLREDGVRLCLEGVTTADEVRRVAGDWDR
jgi:type II secretory ATPase GspE/PulE/Tfp pilus assembly ATPase PilB-like protein